MAWVDPDAGAMLARMPGVQPLLDAGAETIRARAEANAKERFRTGRYSGAFAVRAVPGEKGVTDRVVENTFPQANAIEFGHFADGKDGAPGRFVPGQFNLTRAVR